MINRNQSRIFGSSYVFFRKIVNLSTKEKRQMLKSVSLQGFELGSTNPEPDDIPMCHQDLINLVTCLWQKNKTPFQGSKSG